MPRFDDSNLRMIDANLNRCREGLRVMEDCARFVLDDAQLSERLKRSRHDLRQAVESLPLSHASLIESRDTNGDVGTRITTDTERQRPGGVRDMVCAAAKRSAEALRVIEEAAKTLGDSGSLFERIRYALYDIERDLLLTLRPPCPQWTLCVLVTAELCTHHSPETVITHAAEGGADCIQIREKLMPDAQLLEHAGLLTEHAHALGLHVMINDRVHIAKLIGADGVHLGQDDLPVAAARSLLGSGYWIGRTCPTLSHAVEAIGDGADTCGLGPIFPSSTKAKPELAGPGLIESYLQEHQTRQTPLLAISGITPNNIEQLAQIGCPGVAVSGAICSSEDPRGSARAIVESITRHRESGEATISP